MRSIALPSKNQLFVLAAVTVAVSAYFYLMTTRLGDFADASARVAAVIGSSSARQESSLLENCFQKPAVGQRDCVVAVAPKLHDWLTTRQAAKALVPWLQAHPADTEAQSTASGLVDRAWASWHTEYQNVVAQEEAAAHRILDARWNIFSWFRPPMRRLDLVSVKATEDLDMLVNAPALAARFAARRAAHPEDATH